MSELRAALRRATEAYKSKNYVDALSNALAALDIDPDNYEACIFAGKAALLTGDTQQAEARYRHAVSQDEDNFKAWQGLAELAEKQGSDALAIEALSRLVDSAGESSFSEERRVRYLRQLAAALAAEGLREDAAARLSQLLDRELSSQERLEVLCSLADLYMAAERERLQELVEQAAAQEMAAAGVPRQQVDADIALRRAERELLDEALEHSEDDAAENVLLRIMAAAPPSPRYASYWIAYLNRLLRMVHSEAPGSLQRHRRRVAALQHCQAMMRGLVVPEGAEEPLLGGCATALPYETALRLLEIEEEAATSQPSPGGLHSSRSGALAAGVTLGASPSLHGFLSGALSPGFTPPSSLPRAPPRLSAIPPRSSSGSVSSPLPAAAADADSRPFAAAADADGGAFAAPPRDSLSLPPPLPPQAPPVGGLSAAFSKTLPPAMAQAFTAAVPDGGGPPADAAAVQRAGSLPRPGSLSRQSSVDTAAGAPAAPLPMGVALIGESERIAQKLARSFPWSPAAQIHIALGLARRCDGFRGHHMAARRRTIIKALRGGLSRDASSAAGWLCLAQMCLADEDASGALAAARRGLQYVALRRHRGSERMEGAALQLRLMAGRALFELGRLDDASQAFNLLHDWVSEGDVAFGTIAGMLPVSVRQEARRGLARVALTQGDPARGKMLYEGILGRSLRGFSPAEHWAHAEYGWLLFEEGNLSQAKAQLEMAIQVGAQSGLPEWKAAGHQVRLGRIYWALGEPPGPNCQLLEHPQYARQCFVTAAAHDGPFRAEAVEWLGRWFAEVAREPERAKKCFLKALQLDPTLGRAGDALCDALDAEQDWALQEQLCRETVQRCDSAAWAWRRLGHLQLRSGDAGAAVQSLQVALRQDSSCGWAWERLGAAYQAQSRLESALRCFQRALELEPTRLFSSCQMGQLLLDVDRHGEAAEAFEAALQHHPDAILPHHGAARATFLAARQRMSLGALAVAWKLCGDALAHTAACCRMRPDLKTVWKLRGDCAMLQAEASGGASEAGPQQQARVRRSSLRLAASSYRRAAHGCPWDALLWADLACALDQQRLLKEAAQGVDPGEPAAADGPPDGAAEKLLRGALRLQPSSPQLWAALGNLASAAVARELALTRSLQLDLQQAPVWARLGMLYAAQGCAPLARQCFDQARMQDAELPAAWEAMAALEQLQCEEAGSSSALDLFEQAVELGAGARSQLGFAVHALRAGRGCEGQVITAALSAARRLPFNPAAAVALAAVQEQRGSLLAALQSLQRGRELLLLQQQRSSERGRSSRGRPRFRCLRSSAEHLQELLARLSLKEAQLLGQAGRPAEALAAYADLEAQQLLPMAAAAHACSLARCHAAAGSPQLALQVLEEALLQAADPQQEAAAELQVADAAVEVLCGEDADTERLAAATSHAEELARRLRRRGLPPHAAGLPLLRAAARLARCGHPAEACAAARRLVALLQQDGGILDEPADADASADLAAAASCVQAAALMRQRRHDAALRQAARAVRLCPHSAFARRHLAALATAAIKPGPRPPPISHSAEAARLAVGAAARVLPRVEDLAAGHAGPEDAVADGWCSLNGLRDAAVMLAGPACMPAELLQQVRSVQRRLHAHPGSVRLHFALAALLLQAARRRRSTASCARRGLGQALRAARLLRSSAAAQAAEPLKQQLLTQLLLAASDCALLLQRVPNAGKYAAGAARVASDAGLGAQHLPLLAAAVHRQKARCAAAASDAASAVAELQSAAALGDVCSCLEAAALLQPCCGPSQAGTRANSDDDGPSVSSHTADPASEAALRMVDQASSNVHPSHSHGLALERSRLLLALHQFQQAEQAASRPAAAATCNDAAAHLTAAGAYLTRADGAADSDPPLTTKELGVVLSTCRRHLICANACQSSWSSRATSRLASDGMKLHGQVLRGRAEASAALAETTLASWKQHAGGVPLPSWLRADAVLALGEPRMLSRCVHDAPWLQAGWLRLAAINDKRTPA